jgi:prefoldin subunit 5
LREVAALQERIQELQRELEEREEEKEKLEQALNLENFKYELLVDLVSW